jgi:hypothetical protein
MQQGEENLAIDGAIAAALWEDSDSRLGKTYWQSIDSMLVGEAGYLLLNNRTGCVPANQ